MAPDKASVFSLIPAKKEAPAQDFFFRSYSIYFSMIIAAPSWSQSSVISFASALTAGTAFPTATGRPAARSISTSLLLSPTAITDSMVMFEGSTASGAIRF